MITDNCRISLFVQYIFILSNPVPFFFYLKSKLNYNCENERNYVEEEFSTNNINFQFDFSFNNRF